MSKRILRIFRSDLGYLGVSLGELGVSLRELGIILTLGYLGVMNKKLL